MIKIQSNELEKLLSSGNGINWRYLSGEYILPESVIRDHSNEVDWWWITCRQTLSSEFLDEIFELGVLKNIKNVCTFQQLSVWFIDKYKEQLDWNLISKYQPLSEDMIEKFSKYLNWTEVVLYQKLSEKFIWNNRHKFVITYVIKHQKLSEGFIRAHLMHPKCLELVINYQKLSDKFILENLRIFRPYASALFDYQNLSSTCMELLGIHGIYTGWRGYSIEKKRKYIKEHTNYELVGDKVIAYKSTRSNGYSIFNLQYKYEVGGEYESHANYNYFEPNSYGLSAWSKKGALSYYDRGKLFKVEIDLEDIACIVTDLAGLNYGGKIRATKIKVLEEVKYDRD